MRRRAVKPKTVVTTVYREHVHGLRIRCRHVLSWDSIMMADLGSLEMADANQYARHQYMLTRYLSPLPDRCIRLVLRLQ